MNIISDKLLVVAEHETKAMISRSLEGLPGLEMLCADSENKAFELIYTHFFVLVIVEETLRHIDLYKIGSMLLSHKNTHNTPLLILADTIQPGKFLADFKALHIDYLARPADPQMILAKIALFFDLFKQKAAVDLSLAELDRVYQKMAAQHDQILQDAMAEKAVANHSTVIANLMQNPLRSLQGNLYQLLHAKNIPREIKATLTVLKTAAERITQITRQLRERPEKSNREPWQNFTLSGAAQNCRILYVESSDEDFRIFNHFIRGVTLCTLVQAKTLAQGLELISETGFDLIFINHALPDGSGLDLLLQLNRMRSDVPVIFTLDKPNRHKGPEALSKGAYTYFEKEKISTAAFLSIIGNTLQKAKISQAANDAQNRIVMISRRDTLTRLYNRQCFEQELESEMAKTKRYNMPLTILMMGIDHFKAINQSHGHDTGNLILTTCAALIQSMVRTMDIVCRYGGDSFGIVMPSTALTGARMLAERIRKKIAVHPFENGSAKLQLTLSIGIATYSPTTVTPFSDLIKNAMTALSEAMEQGGNTVKTFNQNPSGGKKP